MNSEFCIAVHSLAFLNRKGSRISSTELAKNVCTNPARIRMVMAKLKKANLITTKEGLDGGYRLKLSPKEISLYEVSEALHFKFVSSWKSKNIDLDCLVASGMETILGCLYEDLNTSCKERLKQINIDDIDRKITENSLNKETVGGNL